MNEPADDVRSRKIVVVSHCVLNQNSTVGGTARFPGSMTPVVQALLEKGIGIYQMTCPEMSCYGAMRWGQVRAQYNTPMFRRHCQEIAERVLDEIEDYRRSGYEIVGVIMIDGSPTCGLNRTCEPAGADQQWGGTGHYSADACFVPGPGVFCEIFQAEAKRRDMGDLLYVAVPETDNADELRQVLGRMMGELLRHSGG